MKKPHMVKKCASPGMDHFSSLRWPNTSVICVHTRVPMSSVRPVTGWPDMISLNSHSTRRAANSATIAVPLRPSANLMIVCVVTEGHSNASSTNENPFDSPGS